MPPSRSFGIKPGWILLLLAALSLAWWGLGRRSRRLAREAERLDRHRRALQSANERLQNESRKLREQATNDPLTGVLNRQAFAVSLRELLEHLAHYGHPLHLIILDLDHFKHINDRLGHMAGDGALKLVTGVAHEHLDSADLLGRFGGDEFLIACADQDSATVLALAETIRSAVEAAAREHDPPLPGLTLSMGLASAVTGSHDSVDELFARADAALYEAKRRGRNRVVVADENLATPSGGHAAQRHL